jgi:hypothetical protein
MAREERKEFRLFAPLTLIISQGLPSCVLELKKEKR